VLLQHVLEEVPEELQRDVLEGERRYVGEAEEIEARSSFFSGVTSSCRRFPSYRSCPPALSGPGEISSANFERIAKTRVR